MRASRATPIYFFCFFRPALDRKKQKNGKVQSFVPASAAAADVLEHLKAARGYRQMQRGSTRSHARTCDK